MCIAIVNAKKTIMDEKRFNICWDNNPDGFGMAWVEGNKIMVYKTLNDRTEAYKLYVEAKKTCVGDMLLHFRIATSGGINLANCHPFVVDKDLVFIHNGILDIKSTKKRSDTNHFCELLQKFHEGFIYDKAYQQLIEMAIGSSKLAFLDSDGQSLVLNEKLGYNVSGDWYSNKSYEEKKITSFDFKSDRKYEQWINEFGYQSVYKRTEPFTPTKFEGDDDSFGSDTPLNGIQSFCANCETFDCENCELMACDLCGEEVGCQAIQVLDDTQVCPTCYINYGEFEDTEKKSEVEEYQPITSAFENNRDGASCEVCHMPILKGEKMYYSDFHYMCRHCYQAKKERQVTQLNYEMSKVKI